MDAVWEVMIVVNLREEMACNRTTADLKSWDIYFFVVELSIQVDWWQ